MNPLLLLQLLGCDQLPVNENHLDEQSVDEKLEELEKELEETDKEPEEAVALPPRDGVYSAENIAALSFREPYNTQTLTPALKLEDRHTATLNVLRSLVTKHGLRKDNPWATVHALLALGKDAKLPDGRSAVDALFSDHAETFTTDGIELVRFPRTKRLKGQDIRVEPHMDMILKVLLEIGVHPERKVQVEGKDFIVGDLYRGSLLRTHMNPYTNSSSYSSTNDMPWGIQALSTWAPEKLKWKALNGQEMELNQLVLFTAVVLAKENDYLSKSMSVGADFKKNGEGIFKYTCGGSHLLQGVAMAHARGFGGDKTRDILLVQSEVLFYRFPRELRIYDDVLKKNPQHKQSLLLQRLKFVGHFLESAAKLILLTDYQPRPEHQAMLKGAADQLTLTVEALKREGLIGNPETLLKTEPQKYLDIIGDSAHAVYGIELMGGLRSISK
jgi:hypothetical protein